MKKYFFVIIITGVANHITIDADIVELCYICT